MKTLTGAAFWEGEMEQRRLGKTGQISSILTFGGFAIGFNVAQKEVDAAIEMALEAGVNRVDVAPDYGKAEVRLGSYFKRHGNPFFLGCKTTQRTKTEARESLEKSLEKLHVDYFDIFQFHGVKNQTELDTILGPDGALEAVLEARKQGLVKFIGITGHHPVLFNKALQQYDFDTVMFPLNRVHAAHFNNWNDWRPLLETAREKNVGVFAIKTVAKRVWPDGEEGGHKYQTWYEPFDKTEDIEKCVRYTLSQDITTAVLPGELKLWPDVIKAAQRFEPMTLE
jgi:predicted aldo/keto reductase-like oxidoreductase